MANNYKNIVITPNRDTDAANVPVIRFSGGDATTNTDINVRVYTSQSGTLSFEGSAGQLFSITNDLTNSIFSVNDVSGIPSIDVYANGNILLAPFGGQIFVGNTANLNFDSTRSTKIVEPAANILAFHTAQTERVRIDGSGSIGIGTTPSEKFHVSGNTILQTGGNSSMYLRRLGTYNRFDSYNWPITTGYPLLFNASTYDFQINDSTKLSIDSSGNVGIGTSSPGNKLHVSGTVTVKTGSSAYQAIIDSAVTTNSGYYGVWNSSAVRIGYMGYWDGTNFHAAYTDSTTAMIFGTNSTERMRIDGSGVVTIGGVRAATVNDVTTVSENAQTGTSYTLALADAGKLVTLSNAAAITLTIPTNASVAFPINTRIDIIQYGAGQVTVGGAGVTIRSAGSKLKLSGQYSGATLWKKGTDEWVLIGDIVS